MKNNEKATSKAVRDMTGKEIVDNDNIQDVEVVKEESFGPQMPQNADAPEREEEMVQIPLNDVNGFMAVVDAVMIDDVRASVLIKHFTKMLIKSNPHLKQDQQ